MGSGRTLTGLASGVAGTTPTSTNGSLVTAVGTGTGATVDAVGVLAQARPGVTVGGAVGAQAAIVVPTLPRAAVRSLVGALPLPAPRTEPNPTVQAAGSTALMVRQGRGSLLVAGITLSLGRVDALTEAELERPTIPQSTKSGSGTR